MNAFIAVALLIIAYNTNDPLYALAAGTFAIAAEIYWTKKKY